MLASEIGYCNICPMIIRCFCRYSAHSMSDRPVRWRQGHPIIIKNREYYYFHANIRNILMAIKKYRAQYHKKQRPPAQPAQQAADVGATPHTLVAVHSIEDQPCFACVFQAAMASGLAGCQFGHAILIARRTPGRKDCRVTRRVGELSERGRCHWQDRERGSV